MDEETQSNVITRKQTVSIYYSSQEDCIAIRTLDWKRIQKRISRMSNPGNMFPIWYPILFGISASFGVSIYPLMISQGLPVWIVPAYTCICISSLIIGLIFVRLDSKLMEQQGSDIKEFEEDMEELENTFKLQASTGTTSLPGDEN